MRFNPFNPQQPAKPNFFVGREREIKTFENYLGQTIHGSPMNMSIMGDRGMGKTSILNKFEEIAKNNNCLVVKISNYEGNVKDVVEFSDFLIANIQTELLSRDVIAKNFDSIKKWASSLNPTISYQGVGLSMQKKQIIQELIRERLNVIWEKVKEIYRGIVILIDEAESLEKINALIFLREIFQRVESDCNYMVVLAGKLSFPEKMSESFSPLNRFFPAERLKKLNKKEVIKYIKHRLSDTDVSVDFSAITKITKKSEGHPYVVVNMGFLIFESLRDNESQINNLVVGRCMEKIKRSLSDNYFAPMFHPLRPKAKSILCSIAENIQGVDFTFAQALETSNLNEPNRLSPYLGEFVRQGIITKKQRGEYKIFHRLFKEYIVSVCNLYK